MGDTSDFKDDALQLLKAPKNKMISNTSDKEKCTTQIILDEVEIISSFLQKK
jgi:hypothetical protein